MSMYGRYVKLTEGARKMVRDSWYGSLHEIRNFCRSAIFMSPKRYLDENFVAQTFEHLSKNLADSTRQHDPKAARIIAALKNSCGNRSAAAKDLGISTTTLWRTIKKYNLSEDDWM